MHWEDAVHYGRYYFFSEVFIRGAIGILTSMLHGNAGILLFGNAFMILLFLLGEL